MSQLGLKRRTVVKTTVPERDKDLPEACMRAWHRAPNPIRAHSKLGATGGAPVPSRLAALASGVPLMEKSQPVLVPSQLVWQLIKGNNSFIVNGLHGKKFSSEPGNLYNLHSYKHSGLANEKTVHICAGEDGGVRLSKSRPKHGNKPALFKHSTVAKKKNFRRTAANVGKDVHSFRPDLKAAALARMSAVHRSQNAKAAADRKG